jgi:hypothetical protein
LTQSGNFAAAIGYDFRSFAPHPTSANLPGGLTFQMPLRQTGSVID